MEFVNYQKRKNVELFKSLEESTSMFLSKAQNYVPIYSRFFSLNDINYNGINLNNKWYISSVNECVEENSNIYNCKIKSLTNNKTKAKEVFFKLAPLLDPYKYLIGKYNILDEKLFNLPKLNSSETDCHPKFIDPNNSAYVDGLFLFLTSNLSHVHNFPHSVDYYGSFLGIKNNFILNVFDDLDYLNNSDFFNKNKNKLFKIDDYDYLFQDEIKKLKPIIIEHNKSEVSCFSINSIDNNTFEDIFQENIVDFNDLKEMSVDLVDINMLDTELIGDKNVTLHSSSTCSSRSSYTNDNDACENCDSVEDLDAGKNNDNEDLDENNDKWEDDDESSEEEERINVTITKFPVQVIGMECCENTFDDLILNNELSTEEWFSSLMQIIMILITFQKAFGFTHNDLHTNNVMYNHTDKKYIYYCYKKINYKVPTFGRIFKIIDFGRSIYKFDGKLFCSDSFQNGNDAATQYNIEPYLNESKPRLEPNFSFDLCRLACSIFDYVVDDIEEVKDLSKCTDPVKKLIVEWCLDDKGINMLYKNNGQDRYPDFKLYKMIARCVHNHTPQAQLERPEFDAFSKFKGEISSDIINIDTIPSYV